MIVCDPLSGVTPVTKEIATKLAELTKIPTDIWLRREAQFQQDLARLGQ